MDIQGLSWPDDVGERWQHALKHVHSIEWAIAHCARRRTAVQAGGNVGLWPRRLAEVFARVITFEPEPVSRACLTRNVPASVEVRAEALGAADRACAVKRRSLGSHRIVDGGDVPMVALDSLALSDVDFLQLDVEGYEGQALLGARETIARCHPLIQIELRDMGGPYGDNDAAIRQWLGALQYREVSRQQGSDFVFAWGAAR